MLLSLLFTLNKTKQQSNKQSLLLNAVPAINKNMFERFKHPSFSTVKRPVFITAHGFGASPFEWSELKSLLKHKQMVLYQTYS